MSHICLLISSLNVFFAVPIHLEKTVDTVNGSLLTLGYKKQAHNLNAVVNVNVKRSLIVIVMRLCATLGPT